MYCSKCGKENSNESKFCSSCGAIIQQGNNIVDPTKKAPLMEVITFTEHPSREQTTIDMHQKMGWSLKSSQEINSSTTHVYGQSYNGTGHVNSYVVKEHYVKLTFERDRNMHNYGILKEKYDEFCRLSKQIEDLEASANKLKKQYFILPLLTSVVIFFAFCKDFIYKKNFFGNIEGIDWFLLITLIFLCFSVGVVVFAFEMAISTAVSKKKISPKVDEIYKQMDSVANEAEKYL